MNKFYDAFCSFCASIVAPLANLAARIYVGYSVFFVSGLAKFADLEETVENFDPAEDGDFALSFIPESIPPEIPAYMATFGELILPVLLVLGLFTRIGAAGLFVMAAVIQIWVFQLNEHYYWMLILGLLVGYGGNKISLDYLLLKRKV